MTNSSLQTINASGYPLQVALHGSVDSETHRHGWQVRYAEHEWSTLDRARNGFADLVVVDKNSAVFAVIECKRVRDTEWVFFHSDGDTQDRRHAQAWLSQFYQGAFKQYGWTQLQIEPFCPEVQFCAVRGQSTKDGVTILEKTAAEVALATECIAREHKDLRRDSDTDIKVFFPVIATTAKLRIAKFDPKTISLQDGIVPNAEFIDVSYVRFRKQLGVVRPGDQSPPLSLADDIAYLKESTVFVVHAPAMNEFLSRVNIQGAGLASNVRAA